VHNVGSARGLSVGEGVRKTALLPWRPMTELVEFLSSPAASILFLVSVTATLVVVGVYVIGKVRGGLREREPKSSELLTNFQELHAQGELDDEEFRTIKAMLSAKLQQELNEADKTR
jgi:hypothetical protein